MKILCVAVLGVVVTAVLPPAAQAQAGDSAPPPAITVSGSAAIVYDYRFRGVSQSDRELAVQGGITLAHASGVHGGMWASNLAGWGTFGGANMELDLIGGYKAQFAGNATLDVGLTWYMYPRGADKTDFAEPYVKLTGTAGPATLTAGVAYAPSQQAIGKWYATGADEVHLTRKEHDVLAVLARHIGRVVTHDRIIATAWTGDDDPRIEYLRIVVRNLRQKLEAPGPIGSVIANELGVGYRLKPDG